VLNVALLTSFSVRRPAGGDVEVIPDMGENSLSADTNDWLEAAAESSNEAAADTE